MLSELHIYRLRLILSISVTATGFIDSEFMLCLFGSVAFHLPQFPAKPVYKSSTVSLPALSICSYYKKYFPREMPPTWNIFCSSGVLTLFTNFYVLII